ncbi:unnamed protein product [Sphacelaria rigidula]
MRRGAAARELHCDQGLHFVADGYELVSTKTCKVKFFANQQILPKGSYLWLRGSDNLRWLSQTRSANLVSTNIYIMRFIDGP